MILVVEDDASMRELLASVLIAKGYSVDSAANGQEALERLGAPDTPTPALVVADVRMPKVDGFGVLRFARSLDDAPSVILVTAFGDELTHRRARSFGADAVIDKPFDLDKVAEVIEASLAKRGRTEGNGSPSVS